MDSPTYKAPNSVEGPVRFKRARRFSQKTKGVLTDTYAIIQESQLFITASSLAYTTILSLIPILALSFVVFRAFGGLDKLYDTLEPAIISNLSPGTGQEAMERIRSFIDNVNTSTVGAGGFLGLVFTSMSVMMSVENAFHRIWKVQNNRTWFHRISAYWLCITLGPLALSIGLGIVTSFNLPLARFLPSGSGVLAVAACLLTLAYKFIPNTRVNWKFALISGFWTAVLGSLTRLGFNLYTSRFASYNKIYGSLAAVPILLFWIYLVWLTILGGAVFSATLQKRLDSKSTER